MKTTDPHDLLYILRRWRFKSGNIIHDVTNWIEHGTMIGRVGLPIPVNTGHDAVLDMVQKGSSLMMSMSMIEQLNARFQKESPPVEGNLGDTTYSSQVRYLQCVEKEGRRVHLVMLTGDLEIRELTIGDVVYGHRRLITCIDAFSLSTQWYHSQRRYLDKAAADDD